MGLAQSQREIEPRKAPEGLGMLFFIDEPVFPIEVWEDDDQVLARAVELDLVGIGGTRQEAVSKLGGLIMEYVRFLNAEGDDRTEAEQETFDLILERIGPPLVKYHMRASRKRIWKLVRQLLGASAYWGVAPSTLVSSDTVLHV
jgi:hypothetical protein